MKRLVLRHFFNNVMVTLGHHGWTLNMKPGHDSYCWLRVKRIDLGMDYNGDLRQILLHEVAHIGTARFCNQKHNAHFWRVFEGLTAKWLKSGPDENQLRHKHATGGGIYAVHYNDSTERRTKNMEDMEIVASINNVKAWMGELLREGCNPNDYLNITENSIDGDSSGKSESIFRFSFYTKLNEYHIVAVQRSVNDKYHSYLGCTCTSRIREPGEDWNRGRDLKDGKLSRYTWEKIKDDILWHELVQISPYILGREGRGVTEEKTTVNEFGGILYKS